MDRNFRRVPAKVCQSIRYDHLLTKYSASDDVADCDKVRIVLQNLREVRDLKAREGFKQISETHLRVDNLGAMEINLIRPQFLIGMNQIRRLHAGYVPEEPKNIDDDEYDVTK